jgi:hypothetical protein
MTAHLIAPTAKLSPSERKEVVNRGTKQPTMTDPSANRRTMNRLAITVALTLVAGLIITAPVAATNTENDNFKVYVCKYVGTPGEDERLQTGQNPIEVSVNAIKDYDGVGSYFNDAQGRSFVLATVPQVPEPTVADCPGYVPPKPPDPPKPPEPPVVPPPVVPPPNLPEGKPLVVPPPVVPPPPAKYAPSANIFGPCGDPRVIVTLDNSQSTMQVGFKIIYKHGAKDKRIVKRYDLAPGQIHYTGWLWVRGNGNFVRVRDQYQNLLAKTRIINPTPWGEGRCPAGLNAQ